MYVLLYFHCMLIKLSLALVLGNYIKTMRVCCVTYYTCSGCICDTMVGNDCSRLHSDIKKPFICKTVWFYTQFRRNYPQLFSSNVLAASLWCYCLCVRTRVCVCRPGVSRVSGQSCSGTRIGQNIWKLFPTPDTEPPTYRPTGINWCVSVCTSNKNISCILMNTNVNFHTGNFSQLMVIVWPR